MYLPLTILIPKRISFSLSPSLLPLPLFFIVIFLPVFHFFSHVLVLFCLFILFLFFLLIPFLLLPFLLFLFILLVLRFYLILFLLPLQLVHYAGLVTVYLLLLLF